MFHKAPKIRVRVLGWGISFLRVIVVGFCFQVIEELEKLLSSDLCQLCTITVRDDLEGVIDLCRQVQSSEELEPPPRNATQMFKDAHARPPEFFSSKVSDNRTDGQILGLLNVPKFKTLWGMHAIDHALRLMGDQVLSGERVSKPTLKSMLPHKYLLDVGQLHQWGVDM